MLTKLLSAVALSFGLLFAGSGPAEEKPADCCKAQLACCGKDKACCQALVRTDCCAKAMKCCAKDAGCCAAVQECCRHAAICCDAAKACCGKPAKRAATGCCGAGCR